MNKYREKTISGIRHTRCSRMDIQFNDPPHCIMFEEEVLELDRVQTTPAGNIDAALLEGKDMDLLDANGERVGRFTVQDMINMLQSFYAAQTAERDAPRPVDVAVDVAVEAVQ